MRMDSIERDVIIINPYRFKNPSAQTEWEAKSIQKDNLKNLDKTYKESSTELSKQVNQNFNISQEELKKIIEEIKHKMSMLEKYLQINIDEQLQMPISKIIDMRTEEVIRQIPPEWIVEILRRVEELRGVFYSKEV